MTPSGKRSERATPAKVDSLVGSEASNATTPSSGVSSERRVDDTPSHQASGETAVHDATQRRPLLGAAKLIFGSDIERIHIDTCRASNAQADRIRGLVAVFVGGTGGIGRSTARELFKRSTAPTAYIVGRNESAGGELVDELIKLNPHGKAIFLQKDCSLLKNVDELCKDLMQREQKINCLFLTAGYMTTRGRTETIEGLDRKMTVNYYSRIRIALNLMPRLKAAREAGELSRVISVLAAGSESEVRLDDLDLRRHFSLHACLAHCVLLSDFMMEELAKRYPHTSFSHSYPGTVKTGIANELNGAARLAVKVLYAVMSPWIINVDESGERHFFQMTSKCYPPANGGVGIDVPQGLAIMRGSNDEQGSGSYLLDWDGKPTGDEKVLKKYRALDFGRTAWEHTMQMFEQAEQSQKQAGEKRMASDTPEGSTRSGSDPVGWRPG